MKKYMLTIKQVLANLDNKGICIACKRAAIVERLEGNSIDEITYTYTYPNGYPNCNTVSGPVSFKYTDESSQVITQSIIDAGKRLGL